MGAGSASSLLWAMGPLARGMAGFHRQGRRAGVAWWAIVQEKDEPMSDDPRGLIATADELEQREKRIAELEAALVYIEREASLRLGDAKAACELIRGVAANALKRKD
jgi:hypothetical protein